MTQVDDGGGSPRHSVLADWTRKMVDSVPVARSSAILAELGIERSDLERRDGRLQYDAAMSLWSRLGDHNPVLGLRFADQLELANLGVLGYFAAASDTIAMGLERMVRFNRLMKDPTDIDVVFETDRIVIVQLPPPGCPPWPRQLAEAIVGGYIVLSRRASGVDFAARAVRFQHATPPSTAEHVQMFGCEPEFDAPRNELVLDRAVGELPIRGANRRLSSYLQCVVEQHLAALPVEDELVGRVRDAVLRVLPEGSPRLDVIARRLGLGGRTLQRRLDQRGISYQELIDDVRRRTAHRLVADDALTVDHIALLLGFSDARGFQRAWRRWTGHSPRRDRLPRQPGGRSYSPPPPPRHAETDRGEQ